MLPKKRRIHKAFFEKVLAEGKSFHSSFLSLKAIKDQESKAESRFSFVVSKKVSPLATKRNLLRRRGYSIIKKAWGRIPPSFTCIFILKKGVGALSFKDFEKEVLFLLEKARIIT
jgi:ribonuclease P protein component